MHDLHQVLTAELLLNWSFGAHLGSGVQGELGTCRALATWAVQSDMPACQQNAVAGWGGVDHIPRRFPVDYLGGCPHWPHLDMQLCENGV